MIGPRGEVVARAPEYQAAVLRSAVVPRKGLPPYAFVGNWLVVLLAMAGLSAVEKRWAREGGGYFSHEAICILNTGARATRCELTVYFEAARAARRHIFTVPARRSIHLRLDKLRGPGGGLFIPKNAPVGYKLVSFDAPVVVQGSRILTSGRNSEFASFGTTMAWTPQ